MFKNIISKIIFLGIKVNLELYLPNIMVNSKYFPSNGTAKEVGGMISANNKKNTVRESNMEIQSVTWNFNYRAMFRMMFKNIIPLLYSTIVSDQSRCVHVKKCFKNQWFKAAVFKRK